MKKKLGLTETYMLSARGEIGRYKLETKRDSILIGLVALQKKAYCLALAQHDKCYSGNAQSSIETL